MKTLAYALLAVILASTGALAQSISPDVAGPTRSSAVEPETLAQQSSPGSPEPRPSVQPRVQVSSIYIDGAGEMLSKQEIQILTAPYAGQLLSATDLAGIADKVTEALKAKGFFLARALLPVQSLDNGEVHIEILQGTVGKVTVEGNEHYSEEFIRAYFEEALGPDGTVEESAFQRSLLLLNENMDLKVRAVLSAGAKRGTTDVTLRVEDATPIHGGIGYDNFGSQFTDIHRAGLSFDWGNLTGNGDVLSLHSLLGIPNNDASFFQAAYSIPLNSDGLRLGLSYANGASTLGRDLQVLDIRGQANIYGAAVSYPLQRSLTTSQDLTLGYSYKDIRNFLLGVPTGRDVYSSLRLGYQGDFQDEAGRNFIQLALTQGLGGVQPGDPLASRFGATGSFTKLNVDLARVQYIADPLFVLLRGGAQFTGEPLLVAEQYALGGPDSVRGFPQAEVLGDQGYSVSAEFRWVPLRENRDFQLAFFCDHGGASLRNAFPGQRASVQLTGAGAGLRFALNSETRFRLDVGFPIYPRRNTLGESPVFYGQVQTRF